jgi:hypothetical protein
VSKDGEDGEDREALETGCVCVPGITIPCKARTHETKGTVRKTAIDIFKAVQSEPHAKIKNKRANKYGRCPFPVGGIELVTTISSLADCLSDTTVRALMRHMNNLHGTKLGVP